MIYAIVGRPRGGKSYESVAFHVLPALKEGRKVITNLTLNVDHFVNVLGSEVRDLIVKVDGKMTEYGSMQRPFSHIDDYKDEWRNDKGQGPLYVIDEAHLAIPSRSNNVELLEFYSLHGHYGIDIILITQNLRKVHRDVRDMIQMTYLCVKNTAFGSDKTYTRHVKDGCSGATVNTSIRKYEKAYFPFYKSHSQSSSSVLEASAKDVTPFWRRPIVMLNILFVVVGLPFAIYVLSDSFSSSESESVQAAASPIVETPTGKPQELANSKPTKKPKSTDFGLLESYTLTVSGEVRNIVYKSVSKNRAEIDRQKTFYFIYFDVFADAKRKDKLFTITNVELTKVGYQVEPLTDCVFKLTYFDSTRLITCNQDDSLPREEKIEDSAFDVNLT